MSLRKMTAKLLFILILVFSMTACGGQADTSSKNKKSKEPVAEAPKIDLNGESIKLAMWWDAAPKADTELGEMSLNKHKEAEEKYNAKIEYLNVPWGEMVSKTAATALSGEPFADIIRLQLDWVPGLIAGGYLKPLNDFIDINKEELLPDAVKKVGTINGKLYGFMDSFNGEGGLYYNKTLFKREGLPDPYELQEKGEWTWSAYLEAAKKLTKDTDGDGIPDTYGISADPTILATYLILSNNGKIIDEEKGTVAFDSPEALEAYEFMAALYSQHKVIKPNEGNNWEDPRKYFTQGLVGMTQGWAWEGGGRKKDMTDEWGYVFFPKGPKAADYMTPVTNGHLYFIPSSAKHPKESYQIWKALQMWDKVQDGYDDWLEANLPDENSVNTGKEMPGKMVVNLWEAYGIQNVFTAMNEKIASAEEPPATATAKVKQEAQSAIDKALGRK